MPTQNYFYGWRPDVPDVRDKRFSASLGTPNLPAKVDLSNKVKTVYNQGRTNSCTANAIAAAFEFELRRQSAKKIFQPSRLFIYYNEREMINETQQDNGAYIRDGIKSVNTQGACQEADWAFDRSNLFIKPPQFCYTEAQKTKVAEYLRLDNTVLTELKSCLAEGFPFVFGFAVYSKFETETAETGMLNLPDTAVEQFMGGHAVMAVGYDDADKTFLILNSWGASWGNNGFFRIPYEYLTNLNLADDFWTIRLIKQQVLSDMAIMIGKTNASVNVRSQGNTSAPVLRKIKKNIKVDIFEEVGGWYRISASNNEWIKATFVAIL